MELIKRSFRSSCGCNEESMGFQWDLDKQQTFLYEAPIVGINGFRRFVGFRGVICFMHLIVNGSRL